jgi:L-alanine-DL-glutamate epimerase-like enolase superfamily enzyme
MPPVLAGHRLTRYEFPRSRPIGDSQIRVATHHIGALELFDADGQVGVGFFSALLSPLPPLAELERVFVADHAPLLRGAHPATLLHRLQRPRGGNIRPNLFAEAINQALWDLYAKQQQLPLFRLLGGSHNEVRAYASGLEFHLPTDRMLDLFAAAAKQGFRAFKLKVGHPDLTWDLGRLNAVAEVVGRDALLMVDANEAWSPKEAIRRAHAYRDAGLQLYWIEDPCLRDDFAGLAQVCAAVPFAHINSGEYLDLRGKTRLMEQRAVDVLNVHGNISDTLCAARLAGEYGIPVALGNTMFELGVHLAAALPECEWMEYSFQDYNHLIEQPVQFVDGYAIAPERPGHGITLSEAARAEYARPTIV